MQGHVEDGVVWLDHPEGRVSIEEQPGGRRIVRAHPAPGTFISRAEWSTAYPVELIEGILRVKGASYLCDEIAREEDPKYLPLFLHYGVFGYLPAEAFRGARLLDFGSGAGASSVNLARMLPDTEIVGVELLPEFIRVAKLRAEFYGLSNVGFLQSPSPSDLPPDLGRFQFVNMGAVYEHLLPKERKRLPAQLWATLDTGGVVFANELPNRFYPVEDHTTGLPLINYLPDRLAYAAARRFSPRISPDATWPELLRAGIRGGTARMVQRDLLRDDGEAKLLAPTMMGLHDHTDVWFAYSTEHHPQHLRLKQAMRLMFKALSRVASSPVAPGYFIAFQKLP